MGVKDFRHVHMAVCCIVIAQSCISVHEHIGIFVHRPVQHQGVPAAFQQHGGVERGFEHDQPQQIPLLPVIGRGDVIIYLRFGKSASDTGKDQYGAEQASHPFFHLRILFSMYSMKQFIIRQVYSFFLSQKHDIALFVLYAPG